MAVPQLRFLSMKIPILRIFLDKNRGWGTAMRDDFHTEPNVQRKDRPCRAPRTASLLVCIVFRPRPFA